MGRIMRPDKFDNICGYWGWYHWHCNINWQCDIDIKFMFFAGQCYSQLLCNLFQLTFTLGEWGLKSFRCHYLIFTYLDSPWYLQLSWTGCHHSHCEMNIFWIFFFRVVLCRVVVGTCPLLNSIGYEVADCFMKNHFFFFSGDHDDDSVIELWRESVM